MKVVFLPAAEHDFAEMYAYIKDDLQNPVAARNIAAKILYRSQSLATFPEMGASLEVVDHRFAGYRYLLVGNYLIIYKADALQVSIVRVLYARSDYVQLLQG